MTQANGSVEVRERAPRRAGKRKFEAHGRLMNLARAAQVLDLAYDTVANAAAAKDLEVAFEVEGTGGRLMPVVTAAALEAYRLRSIARLKAFSSEYHRSRAAALEGKKVAQ